MCVFQKWRRNKTYRDANDTKTEKRYGNWSLQCALLCFCVSAHLFISCICIFAVALNVVCVRRPMLAPVVEVVPNFRLAIFILLFLTHNFYKIHVNFDFKLVRLYLVVHNTIIQRIAHYYLSRQANAAEVTWEQKNCRGQSWVFPILVRIEWNSL